MTPEDEAFNEIERQAKQRKEAVLQALHDENRRLNLYDGVYEKADRNPKHIIHALTAEVEILTELVRVLNARITELEGKV